MKIYYIMDPLCGWCYGFSDVIQTLYKKYEKNFEFEIIPAGMWINDSVQKMNNSLGNYIKTHNEKIEKITGKKFGAKFNELILNSNKIVLDSFVPSKAMVVFEKLDFSNRMLAMKKIQESFFINGQDLNNIDTYEKIARELKISKEKFNELFFSTDIKNETFKKFEKAKKLKIEVFPSVVLENDIHKKLISQGFLDFNSLEKKLR